MKKDRAHYAGGGIVLRGKRNARRYLAGASLVALSDLEGEISRSAFEHFDQFAEMLGTDNVADLFRDTVAEFEKR